MKLSAVLPRPILLLVQGTKSTKKSTNCSEMDWPASSSLHGWILDDITAGFKVESTSTGLTCFGGEKWKKRSKM